MRKTVLITPDNRRLPLLVPETETERTVGANGGIQRPYAGLIFNFDPPSIATMTMKKTPMALQIAFVGSDQIVHTIQDAPARSGTHTSSAPARWVIETLLPWRVLKVGDRVRFEVLQE
jgi:uncharacterized membrane protein (UPF0127 family)